MNSYHYGNPEKQDWSHVADVFAAHESLNSERTSSLPLAQFWKEENLKDRVKNLETICPGITILPAGSELYFEYGISVPDGYGRGKASMTDLMIISKQHAIAIEAKYTEVAKRYETIKSWLKKSSKADDNNRVKVLNGWLKYISEANCFAANLKDSERQIQNVPYQLVHRIASACAVANRINVSPAVIYQIFYDKETCKKAAKFALDDMSYKFFCVDSKLNDGKISQAEVDAERKKIRIEANYYSSLDGFAKFLLGIAMVISLFCVVLFSVAVAIQILIYSTAYLQAVDNATKVFSSCVVFFSIPVMFISICFRISIRHDWPFAG